MTLVSVALSLVPRFATELEGLSKGTTGGGSLPGRSPQLCPMALSSSAVHSCTQLGLGRPSYVQLKPEVDE